MATKQKTLAQLKLEEKQLNERIRLAKIVEREHNPDSQNGNGLILGIAILIFLGFLCWNFRPSQWVKPVNIAAVAPEQVLDCCRPARVLCDRPDFGVRMHTSYASSTNPILVHNLNSGTCWPVDSGLDKAPTFPGRSVVTLSFVGPDGNTIEQTFHFGPHTWYLWNLDTNEVERM